MKFFLQAMFLSLAVIFITSCSDDPEPPHIVGDWNLESYILTDFPEAFSYQEGRILPSTALGFSSYSIAINNDGTYVRKVGVTNAPSLNDQGTWSLIDDDFTLINVDFPDDEETYSVNKNSLDQFWIQSRSRLGSFFLNDTIDAFSRFASQAEYDAYFNSLTAEERKAYDHSVDILLTYTFIRAE